jgi:hypothetical protein
VRGNSCNEHREERDRLGIAELADRLQTDAASLAKVLASKREPSRAPLITLESLVADGGAVVGRSRWVAKGWIEFPHVAQWPAHIAHGFAGHQRRLCSARP